VSLRSNFTNMKMRTIKGPAIFLAQFVGEKAPFDTLDNMCKWVASLGYKGIQIPTWETHLIDLKKAASSQTYCDELRGKVEAHGLEITELSTHLQGQLVAVNPAYDLMFDGFAPKNVQKKPKARQKWAVQQLKWAAKASKNLKLKAHATFSGALMWHTMYPWPQRPAGLVEAGFKELAKRWVPILNEFDKNGIDLCFHVKDAEFNPTGTAGVYGGYANWADRPGRFRSLGDGQVDFSGIFTKLSRYGFDGWAVMEWECCIKSAEQGATEGAPFIQKHIINVAKKAFDDFAGGDMDKALIKKTLGL